jgi:maltooligosyltrehalose trehalohydrolase
MPPSPARRRRVAAFFSQSALALRFAAVDNLDRLLLLNLGHDLPIAEDADPLLAAPPDAAWTLIWSSEDPRYGGGGTSAAARQRRLIPAESAIVLALERHPEKGKLEGPRGRASSLR